MRKYAKIFGGQEDGTLVNADDIKNGNRSREYDFVDPEEEFRVIYVNGAKNHGAAHFRLYMSYEDYIKLTPERRTRFDILKGMDHFDESIWHKEWEEKFGLFAETEKYIKNPDTNKYKRADVYYKKESIVVEVQHSYIASSFKERNDYYSELGIDIIWLFDLMKLNSKEEDGQVEILEDNSLGFFRAAEETNNFKECPVFIQVKNGLIYKVQNLERKVIENELKSTIRYFRKTVVFSEEGFIDAVKTKQSCLFNEPIPKTLFELWKESNDGKRNKIIVLNIKVNRIMSFFKDKNTGFMSENYDDGTIGYLVYYLDEKTNSYKAKSPYSIRRLKKAYAYDPVWILLEVR